MIHMKPKARQPKPFEFNSELQPVTQEPSRNYLVEHTFTRIKPESLMKVRGPHDMYDLGTGVPNL